MNEALPYLVRGMSQQSVQIAAVFLIVAGAIRLLRNRSAHRRYMPWLVVLVKCVTPPVVAVSLAMLPVDKSPSSVIIRPASMERGALPDSSYAYKWAAENPSAESKGTQHPGSVHSLKTTALTEPVALAAAEKSAAPLPAVPSSTFFTIHPVLGLHSWLGLTWIVGAAGFFHGAMPMLYV